MDAYSSSFALEEVRAGMPILGVTDLGLGNTSWLVSLDDQVVIVDPERDPDPYLSALDTLPDARSKSLLAAETHLHADFLSGARGLVDHGATAVVPAEARARWPHHPVVARSSLDLGRWRLDVLPTPGHTPEHVAYLLVESGRPTAVFTGGSLLVGAVARTDLIDPDDTERLTRALWQSINQELLSLPDEVLVLPTHGAGSFCSASGANQRWTTIGAERRMNPLLQADEDAFVVEVLGALGTYPPYFLRLRDRNRLGPQILGSLPLLGELTGMEVAELCEGGALVVDVRSVADYAAGHIPGSLANTLRPQFASWLGWLVDDPDAPMVFVTDSHTDRRELVRQCLNIGYENLAGTVSIDAWTAAGGEVRRTPLVLEPDSGSHVVDVRQDAEFVAGHLPGAIHVELGRLTQESSALPNEALVTMCGHGERAATAASLLESDGHRDISIAGVGVGDWAARTGQTLEH